MCSIEPIENIYKNLDNEHTPTIGAVIFTDLKASSKLWSFDTSKKWQELIYGLVELHFQMMVNIIKMFNKKQKEKGKIIKTIGDACMIYCPWPFKLCLELTLCIQRSMKQLNFFVIKQIEKRYSYKLVLEIYNNIPEPKSGSIHNPIIFGIRIGFCYGDFLKVNTKIQFNDFEDLFGSGVNLASRCESKISNISGAIAFTFYFNSDKKASLFKDEISKILKEIDTCDYIGYAFPTTKGDPIYNIISKDLYKTLHGALPKEKKIIIYLLVPKEEVNKKGHLILDKVDTSIAKINFEQCCH